MECADAISLLLMIKITYAIRLVMQRRRIPVLDAFFDRLSLLLWPRLKFVFDANLRSIRGASPRKLGTIDLTPHYIARRYAEFAASILILQNGSDGLGVGGGGEGMLQHDMQQIRTEVTGTYFYPFFFEKFHNLLILLPKFYFV